MRRQIVPSTLTTRNFFTIQGAVDNVGKAVGGLAGDPIWGDCRISDVFGAFPEGTLIL